MNIVKRELPEVFDGSQFPKLWVEVDGRQMSVELGEYLMRDLFHWQDRRYAWSEVDLYLRRAAEKNPACQLPDGMTMEQALAWRNEIVDMYMARLGAGADWRSTVLDALCDTLDYHKEWGM